MAIYDSNGAKLCETAGIDIVLPSGADIKELRRIADAAEKRAEIAERQAKAAEEQAALAEKEAESAQEIAAAAKEQTELAKAEAESAKKESAEAKRQSKINTYIAVVAVVVSILSWLVPKEVVFQSICTFFQLH